MTIHPAVSPCLLALLLAAAPTFAASANANPNAPQGMDPGMQMKGGKHMQNGKGMSMQNPDKLKWGDAPPVLPKGVQLAVLDGDPHKAGPYVIRLKMPAGYQIPPHWHSRAESVTVVSGTLSLGMGDTLDKKAAQELKPGGFHAIVPEVHHYAFSPKGAVVQIHGEGPFDITYINPADNPDPAAKKPQQQQ